jgi:hypothetical protein
MKSGVIDILIDINLAIDIVLDETSRKFHIVFDSLKNFSSFICATELTPSSRDGIRSWAIEAQPIGLDGREDREREALLAVEVRRQVIQLDQAAFHEKFRTTSSDYVILGKWRYD